MMSQVRGGSFSPASSPLPLNSPYCTPPPLRHHKTVAKVLALAYIPQKYLKASPTSDPLFIPTPTPATPFPPPTFRIHLMEATLQMRGASAAPSTCQRASQRAFTRPAAAALARAHRVSRASPPQPHRNHHPQPRLVARAAAGLWF